MIKNIKIKLFYTARGLHTFVSYWSGYKIAPKPSVLYFETTYRCTCKCGFCERWKVGPGRQKDELSTGQVKKMLLDAKSLGVRFIGLTGGEAFLRKDIFEIGKYAKDLGLNVNVASNGTLINEKNIKKIIGTFDSVTISMDGINKETHDEIRGVSGVYDKAMGALRLFKKYNFPTAVNMVITKKNYNQIEKYIEFFKKENIPTQLTPVHDYETSFLTVKKDLKEIDVKLFKKLWLQLSKKYEFLNNFFYKYVPTFFESPKNLFDKYTCFAGTTMMFVNPYGEIFPCEFYRSKMGDLKEESLSEIWKRAINLRRQISSKKRPCICWTHCVVPLNSKLTKYVCLKKLN